MPCQTASLRQTLDTALEEYLFIRKLFGATTKQACFPENGQEIIFVFRFDYRIFLTDNKPQTEGL